MRNIRLYGHFLRVAILGKAQYKADFFVATESYALFTRFGKQQERKNYE